MSLNLAPRLAQEPCVDRRVQAPIRFPARAAASAATSISAPTSPASTTRRARADARRLYRLRLHRAVAACRLAAADHDAALAAADRRQADRADGRRHHHGRRSLRQGREPQAPDRRADRGQQGRHPQGLRQVSCASATGKTDAIMPDNAEWLAKLNYIEFLRDVGRHFSVNRMLAMDSVKLRLEREQELSLPRIQLHVPAGLRFRRAQPALRLHAADGRLRPVGQHRHRPRPRPPHGHAAALRADLAADHHRVRRQDGQDRRGRGLAQRRRCSRPTTTGSSGATPRTPTSAGS